MYKEIHHHNGLKCGLWVETGSEDREGPVCEGVIGYESEENTFKRVSSKLCIFLFTCTLLFKSPCQCHCDTRKNDRPTKVSNNYNTTR